ncbi:hypothetical protein [Lacimicrobium alkaliphilum]|uniref:Flagellar hook-basal body complex protein FliE n=1 Tax=Lacimicrobium alkaliphilum TaxID=1526571 RepID=A0ABQ1RRG6_9ALTE|nr:hypothetical protein [Lacimicrobium alkaliphilum]GGD77103.1 hypothetical protein GCM10011357_35200 [Lacimicrobium alkaliphilum]
MSVQFDGNINSALMSGMLGVQKASDGITQHSISLAQQQAQLRTPEDVLTDAARQQLGMAGKMLPSGGDNMTSDLVGLSLNLRNAQASTKVLEVVKDTIGTLIDEKA